MSESPIKPSFHGEYTDFGKDLNYYVPSDKKTSDVMKSSSLFMDNSIKTVDVAIHDIKKQLEPYWINSEPLLAGFVDDVGESFLFFINEQIKGQVILIDFWDFTLPQSLRCIQHNKDLLKKYGVANFMIIGIHCSPFPFASLPDSVRQAVYLLGISYPIVIDHDFAIWRSFENRFWPRRILMNHEQKIIFDQVGDAGYPDLERSIQKALRVIAPGLPCPRVFSETDNINDTPARSPDVFFGDEKSAIGNPDSSSAGGNEVIYNLAADQQIIPGKAYLRGPWIQTPNSVYLAIKSYNKGLYTDTSSIKVRFTGSSAYLVAGSRFFNQSDIRMPLNIEILLDGRSIRLEHRGTDIKLDASKRTTVPLTEPRLYEIFKKAPLQEHELEIIVTASAADNLEVYALYFSKR